ncbi:CUB domain-containing protein [Aureibacter tunicatorum]|uniref:PKD repeat protein n=1 Tax=Aureibacter tunicatorum TaxID=866807 RepID=A0AAE4BRJ7_9BACT|nr:CUB domain-containing protein [Aureibacter tunicatorum]MDR6238003.1 PKD repeat protein [Aureibacter tunicatorum]BDD03036.1 hypothetical protein AUTU_05190 [Aureibacter tunicatorum]
MKKLYTLLLGTVMAFDSMAQTQEPCSMQGKIPSEIQESTSTLARRQAKDQYVIPMVFHVIHAGGVENVSDEQIHESIKQLNEDFAGEDINIDQVIPEFQDIIGRSDIRFVLANKDPQGNFTAGINRYFHPTFSANGDDGGTLERQYKQAYGWPREKYLNVFVLKSSGPNSGSAFAEYPSDEARYVWDDGVVTSHWALGRTGTAKDTHYKIMTHEVGHFLNLIHAWGEGGYQVASSCNGDDLVADTPNTIGNSGCNPNNVSCGSLDNTQNYMDYGYCTVMFTQGQVDRMMDALTSSVGGRNNLHADNNLVQTGITDYEVQAQISSEVHTIPVGHSIDFIDRSTSENSSIESWEWKFEGGEPASFSGKTPPAISYTHPGSYDVTLTVTDQAGNINTQVREAYVTVEQDIVMQNGTLRACDTKFFDSGRNSNYTNREDFTLTLLPEVDGNILEVAFNSFRLDNNCGNDYLEIYDGPNTSSTKLGTYCGTNSPGTVTSSHSSGALTFVFHSNVSNMYAGWDADVSCKASNGMQADFTLENENINLLIDPSITIVESSENGSSVINSWEWKFEGANIDSYSGQNPPELTYNAPGIYAVKLTISDGNESISKTTYVTVNKELKIANGTVDFCDGVFVDNGGSQGAYGNNENFVMTLNPGGADKYLEVDFAVFDVESDPESNSCQYDFLKIYDGPDASSPEIGLFCNDEGSTPPSTIKSSHASGALTFEFKSDGNTFLNGWVANVNCVSNQSDLNLDVQDMIVGSCALSPEVRPLVSGGTEPYTYEWIDLSSENTIATSATMNLDAGSYKLIVTDADNSIVEQEFTISREETVEITSLTDMTIKEYETNTTAFSVNVSGVSPLVYRWEPTVGLDDASILNPVPNPAQTTEYTLTVTDVYGCQVTQSVTVIVEDDNVLSSDDLRNEISVFPNPTEGKLQIVSNGLDLQLVEVYSLEGKLQSKYSLEGITEIDLSLLTSGVYQVKVIASGQVSVHKIILK